MPPRAPTSVLRAVTLDTPILPFLYTASSRRLLSATAVLSQDDGSRGPEKFMNLVNSLSKSKSDLPPISNSESRNTSPGRISSYPRFEQSVSSMRKAFVDLEAMNSGFEDVLLNRSRQERMRMDIEESMGDKIDNEVYKYSAPTNTNTYVSPKDLQFEEHKKFQRMKRNYIREDFFEQTQENPLNHYKNFNLLKDFMTTAGRIKHRSLTGLSNVNQRKVSKAIRRAIGIGLMPSVYRHPEVLKTEQKMAMDMKRL